MKIILSLLYIALLIFVFTIVVYVLSETAQAAPPEPNAKFYDFSEQVIDGHIKKPTALYTDSRQKVKFGRLLKLKKSFLPAILDTAKDPVFK